MSASPTADEVFGEAAENSRLRDGLAIRRAVLGDEYVDAALASVDEFNRDHQALVTEYCWGAIWGRPGLARKTRSLVNIALLTALGRNRELESHVRGALRNGCTSAEISEVLLQATVYCGVPAGVDAFRVARAVIGTIGVADATTQHDDA